ncbi:MAG: hypothetical protein AAFV47_12745 [Pseudomonadota bacterium]
MKIKQYAFAIIGSCLLTQTSIAQEELSDDRQVEEREIRQQSISQPFYKRITAIQELMDADETRAEALESAKVQEGNGRLNNYERALLFQTIGFIYTNESNYPDGIKYFEKSLAEDALPNEAQQGMLFSLASLYMQVEEYRKAIDTARRWFKYEQNPSGEAYILIAQAYSQLGEFKNAQPYVEKAIEVKEEPQKSWHQLLLAVYFETDQKPKAIPLLRKMVQIWPDEKQFWQTLSGIHMELKQDQEALATLMVAYRGALLDDDENAQLTLAQLNIFLNSPYTAGVIVEKGLASGVIERNKKNLELLQSAWSGAREYDKALATMGDLGNLTGDPLWAFRQAKVYNELGNWDRVVETAQVAIERNYERPGEAYILIGIAHAESGRLRDAKTAFQSATESDNENDRKNAAGWLAYINDRLSTGASS